LCARKKVSTKNLLNKYEFRKKTLFSASDMLRYEGSNTLRDNYWGQKFDEFNKWSISRSICQMLFITAAYVSIDSIVKPRKKYENLFQKFFSTLNSFWIFFKELIINGALDIFITVRILNGNKLWFIAILNWMTLNENIWN